MENFEDEKNSQKFHKTIILTFPTFLLVINKGMKKEKENNLKCPFCGREFDTEKSLKLHIGRYELPRHSYLEAAEYSCKEHFPDVDPKVYAEYLKRMNKKTTPPYYKQFISFVKMVTCVREFVPSIDFPRFFTKVLPWKKKHPGVCNSKELANVVFENQEEAKLLYERYMLAKNPHYGVHDSTNSPFSMDYKGYEGMTEEEKRDHIKKITKRGSSDRTSTQIGYWIKRGYTEEEAKQKISERQRTFTLEKCIEKYGEEEGRKRWEARQEKWQNTLKNKPKDEIERINRAKMGEKNGYSKVSQELFWKVYNKIKDQFKEVKFATIRNGVKMDDKRSYEHIIFHKGETFFLDFFVKDLNKAIEFDGIYWHSLKNVQERDKMKDECLNDLNIKCLRVNEQDYYNDPQKVINECIQFLKHDD